MGSLLLRNGFVVDFEPLRMERRDLWLVEGRVMSRDPRSNDRDARIIDCRGRYLIPGLVNAHTQLWTSQTLGIKNKASGTRRGPLSAPWDGMDERLDRETVVTAAFAGSLEALRSGTTTIVDLHSSPRCAGGILDLIRDTVLSVGLRAVLSYEVSDAHGDEITASAIAENRDFILNNRSDKVTGLVGATSPIELSDETLERIAETMRSTRQGLKIRAGDSAENETLCRARFGMSQVARLHRFGLLTNRTIIVHGGHLGSDDINLIQTQGAWVVQCPSMEARIGIGSAPAPSFGELVGLGSGGAQSDMFSEARQALAAACSKGFAATAHDIIRIMSGSHQLASEILGIELGSFRRDAVGDILMLNYQPRTPIDNDNLAEHIVYGMGPQHIDTVIVDGNIVFQAGRYPDIDIGQLAPLMRRGAEQLWSRAAAVEP